MMYGRGYQGNNVCFGNNLMGSGWHFFIMAGVLLLIVAIIIFIVRKNTHGQVNNAAFELLKMKFVQGEITEEEYLKRKNTLLDEPKRK